MVKIHNFYGQNICSVVEIPHHAIYLCTVTLPLLSLSTYFYYFYLQQEEILNARGTTLLLGIKIENCEVLDVLLQYFAQHHGIGNFQLPMSIALFKLIKITTAED